MEIIHTIIESETPPSIQDKGLWIKDKTIYKNCNGSWEKIGEGETIQLEHIRGNDPTKAISQKGFSDILESSEVTAYNSFAPKMTSRFLPVDEAGMIKIELHSKSSFYNIFGDCNSLSIEPITNDATLPSIITGRWGASVLPDSLIIIDRKLKPFYNTVPVAGEYFEITVFNNFYKLINSQGYKETL